MKIQLSFISGLFCFLIFSCVSKQNNIISNSYHNTTAHYNAYFIAKERMKEIEATIETGYEWNYNNILPVFPQFDSTVSKSLETQIKDCIKKASTAIQRHSGSNWEDDSYNLVGLARFYGLEFVDAIKTFKYINIKSKNDKVRHKALISLIRTFVEYKEINNAIAVSDYMKKEKLNKKNLKDLYLSRAYLHQKREDYNSMVQNLIQAEKLNINQKERARINFIIGQVYQRLGFESESHTYYKKTLKNNPPYELSFYAKLNMAQVTRLTRINNLKKVRKYFKKLLKDDKNKDFRDKIYFEMANFEVRKENLEQGIEYYNQSIKASNINKRQKAYSYLSLGKIYYNRLANYQLAKNYYDSTLQVMPKDEKEYAEIEKRHKILENFVKQWTIIHDNDSLLNLANLSTDSLDRFLDDYIATQAKKEKKEKRRKRNEKLKFANNTFNNRPFEQIGSSNFTDPVWYFYNSAVISRGKSDFKRVWGNRILEDNWRISNKIVTDNNIQTQAKELNVTTKSEQQLDKESESKIDKNTLLANIPLSNESKQKLLSEVEEAHYHLGNIYNFDLQEKHNATSTFESMLSRFSETEYKLEVMYLLYLLYKELNNLTRSNYYKNILLNNPKSIYAKIIINPNYKEESQASSEQLKKIYAKAYYNYKVGNYKKAFQQINNGLREYKENNFVDNMQLLKILVIGKSESIYKYQYELNNFMKTYSESELIPYVDSLVKASENYQINLVNSAKAEFKTNLIGTHFFVFVYEKSRKLSEQLPAIFEEISEVQNLNLKIGNLILDDKYSIILVSDFENKEKATDFEQIIIEAKPSESIDKLIKYYQFIITKHNFNILYETKELDSYRKFYSKNY